MLIKLSVKNYALIEDLEFLPQMGFNIITGETGAGKSMLLGALGLILGERADLQSILFKEKSCVVEGTFKLDSKHWHAFFSSNDLDFEEKTIIRRTINPSGKSRAFVNDVPCHITVLQAMAGQMIDIHSQHSNLLLNDKSFLFDVLDFYASCFELRKEYTHSFNLYQNNIKELDNLKYAYQKSIQEKDYLEFQLNELLQLAPLDNEELELEQKIKTLNQSDELKETLSFGYHLIQEGELSIGTQLRSLHRKMLKLNASAQLEELTHSIEETYLKLEESALEMSSLAEDLDMPLEDKIALEERFNTFQKLFVKHGVKSATELIEISQNINESIYKINNSNESILELEKEIEELHSRLEKDAEKLNELRKKSKNRLENEVQLHLNQLGMNKSRFIVNLEETEKLDSFGKTKLNYMIAQGNNKEQVISSVASGGEISRIMLALKSVLSQKSQLPTVIYDEIDAGISGEVALQTGRLIQKMAHGQQIISITHLPQVAALAQHHYKVYKTEQESEVRTKLKKLEQKERIEEIAEMLGGKNPKESFITTAKELLS